MGSIDGFGKKAIFQSPLSGDLKGISYPFVIGHKSEKPADQRFISAVSPICGGKTAS
jgi:hypothetical protein